jgi:hypothetical protein
VAEFALSMWLVYVLDGAQRRTIERLRARMELERDRDIAVALAEERSKRLDHFMESFVIHVHNSAGVFAPYHSPVFNLTTHGYAEDVPRAVIPERSAQRPASAARGR